jgi:hypothetical protein
VVVVVVAVHRMFVEKNDIVEKKASHISDEARLWKERKKKRFFTDAIRSYRKKNVYVTIVRRRRRRRTEHIIYIFV